MAQLPNVEYSGVQDITDAQAPVDAARNRMFSTFEQGLSAYGQEMIKSQHNQAQADLAVGLEKVRDTIERNKTVSAQFVRDQLGANFDSLDPAIKSQLTKTQLNPQTGEQEQVDRDDVPTWAVAGALYDAQAKQVLHDASQRISVGGWQAGFQEAAQGEIQSAKARIAEKQTRDMHEYFQATDTQSALSLAWAGQSDEAKAVVGRSATMDGAHRANVVNTIDKIDQTKPIYDAIRSSDYGSMAELVGQLNDPAKFTKLDPQERTAFSERLKSEINNFQNKYSKAKDDQLKAAGEAGWNTILGKERDGMPVSYSDIPMPGTIHAEAQKEMIKYVDTLNKGEKPETDWTTYAGLLEVSKDRAKFSNVNLLSYRNDLADSEFKQLLEIQQSMKGKGNPDAYDKFQGTEQAIEYRMKSGYGIDPKSKDSDDQEKVGYLKTTIQHDLSAAQAAKHGEPLSLEERDSVIDKTLAQEVNTQKGFWSDSQTLPTSQAGIPATVATTFRRAVTALDPYGMRNPDKRVDTLKKQYVDYQEQEPGIERAWQIQHGSNVSPDDAVRSWYYLRQNQPRLEGQLRATGGWTDDEKIRQERLANMAVSEVLGKLGQ